jgi:hypothetical protein
LKNEFEEKIIEQYDSNVDSENTHAWGNHTAMIWNYEGVDVIYSPSQKRENISGHI